MTSSIFRPRRSRAWPEPRTHLTASTMLVLPEPLGPTIAVTPPSKRISVGRAKVLKPNRCSERRNKAGGTVADVGVNSPSGTTCEPHELRGKAVSSRGPRNREGLLQRFPELAAPGL